MNTTPPAAAPSAITVLVTAIFIMLLFFALWAAKAVLIPFVLAGLLALVLTPVRRRLERLGLPRALAALLIMLAVISFLAAMIVALSQPASDWIERGPSLIDDIRFKLRSVIQGIEEVREAGKQVSEVAGGGGQTLVVEEQSLGGALLESTGRFFADFVVVNVLTLFLLASGHQLARNGVRLFPRTADRRRLIRINRQIETNISAYLLTVTLINLGLALAAAGAIWFAGLPNPLLFGALVGLLNYIPYLGPLTAQAVILLVGLATFDSIGQALVAPALVFGLNLLEGQLMTPGILARRLTLNPVLVFVSLVLWGWLWGVAGVLLAVPILASVKIACDEIPSVAGVGRLIGERES